MYQIAENLSYIVDTDQSHINLKILPNDRDIEPFNNKLDYPYILRLSL